MPATIDAPAIREADVITTIETYVCPSCPDGPQVRGEHVRHHVSQDRPGVIRPTVRTTTFGCDHCRRVFRFRRVLRGGEWRCLTRNVEVLRPSRAREFWRGLEEISGEIQLSKL